MTYNVLSGTLSLYSTTMLLYLLVCCVVDNGLQVAGEGR